MGGRITKLEPEDHAHMRLSLSPLSKSKRKPAERELEARLASPPPWNGRSRRRVEQDALPVGASERGEGAAPAAGRHPYMVECSHPLNRGVRRFARGVLLS